MAVVSSSATFAWTAGTNAAGYWLYVGTTPGAYNIYNSNQLSASVFSKTVSGIPRLGKKLYVRMWTLLNGVWGYNDYTYTENSFLIRIPPVAPPFLHL